MDQVSRYQIRLKVKEALLQEHFGEKGSKVLIESGAYLSEGFAEFIGGLSTNLGGAQNFLPKTAITSIKKYFVKNIFDKMGIEGGTPIAEFIENLVVYIPINQIGNIVKRDISCAQFNDILLGAATQTLTNLGLKKVLPPLLQYFSQYQLDFDIGDGTPLFIRREGGIETKEVTIEQVEEILDTLIGVAGETLIAQITYKLMRDSLIDGIGSFLCSIVGIADDVDDLATPIPGPTTTTSIPAPLTPPTVS
jgi:hypothetical protein